MVGRLTTELHADCANCIGLCCVALPFAASADFAIDKPAGTPCRHLRSDFRCEIHEHLRDSGFRGCAVFDCFGAGQRVTARFGRWSRRAFDAFTATRQLHELLWYLHEALGWDTELRPQLRDALARTEALAHTADPDVAAHRAGVAPLLRAASRSVRGAGAPDRSDADLAGTDLRSASIANSDRPARRRPPRRRPPRRRPARRAVPDPAAGVRGPRERGDEAARSLTAA
jgi:hypothetical protein